MDLAQLLRLRAASKHRAIFRENKQGRVVDTGVGEVHSFNDDVTGGFVGAGEAVVVEGYEKPENMPGLSSATSKVQFYFGVEETETNKELLKFLGFLRQNTKYVGKIRFGESLGYLRAFPPQGETMEVGGFRKGFKCVVYKDMRSMHEWVRGKVREIMNMDGNNSVSGTSSTLASSSSTTVPQQSLPQQPEKKLKRGVSINVEHNQEILIENRKDLQAEMRATSAPLMLAKPSTAVPLEAKNCEGDDDSDNVAKKHYDDTIRNKATRHHTNIFHLRNINNFVKGMVIEESSDIIAKKTRQLAVLDLACGKGGDMLKWLFNKRLTLTTYVGADIAEESLKSFVRDRFTNCAMQDKMKISKLISVNLSKDSLSSSPLRTIVNIQGEMNADNWVQEVPLSEKDKFDIISCQFAMHYMFRSRLTANNLLAEVSRHLKPQGLYIATTMDCRTLSHYIRKALHGPYPGQEDHGPENIPGFSSSIDGKKLKILIKNEFDQALLAIQITLEMANKLLLRVTDISEEDGFGIEYDFKLFDSGEEAAVNAPEYMVPLGRSFKSMLKQHNLKVHKVQNFHEYLNEKLAPSLSVAEKMKIWNFNGSLSPAEWAIVRLYNVVMLKHDEVHDDIHGSFSSRSPPSSPPLFQPCSPIYPYVVPSTPDWTAQDEQQQQDEVEEAVDEELDPALLELQRIAEIAKVLCGGEAIWDILDEDDVDKWMEIAKAEYRGSVESHPDAGMGSNKRRLSAEDDSSENNAKRRKT